VLRISRLGAPAAQIAPSNSLRSKPRRTTSLQGVSCTHAFPQVSVLVGGCETTEFWYFIGGFGEVSRSGTMGEAALKAELPSPRAAQSDLAERDQRPRVAIIGGGVAGCAAANYLQRNNVKCFLFEVRCHVLITIHESAVASLSVGTWSSCAAACSSILLIMIRSFLGAA
jgi:hypothetical protein